MSLETSLTPYSLKKLTSALGCLSKVGEDVQIQALKSELILSTLNSSKTSYAQFTFSDNFFQSYDVDMPSKKGITCTLNAKALLGVFRSRGSLEKTAERCDISFYDPDAQAAARKKDQDRKGKKRRKVRDSDDDDDRHSSDTSISRSPSPGAKPPPARLNIKFVCQNGFVKTHSLFISTSDSTKRPTNNTEGEDASSFKVSPKNVNEWLEPFPGWSSQASKSTGGGPKKEGYLAWTFGDHGAKIGTWEGNPRADRLSTEFAVEADEFDEFYLSISPVAFGFPMKEFKAITFLATQLSVPISCVFTTALSPLYITLSHPDDVFDATFTMMTQEVPASSGSASVAPQPVRHVKSEARRKSGSAQSSLVGGGKKKTLQLGKAAEADEQKEEEEEEQRSGRQMNRRANGSRSGLRREEDYQYSQDDGAGFDFAMDLDNSDSNLPDENQEKQPPRHITPRNQGTSFNSPSRRPPTNGHAREGGGKPADEEPLFFPNSQERQQQPPSSSQHRFPASQLSQAQLEDYGLGDMEEMNFDDDLEEHDEVLQAGKTAANGKGMGRALVAEGEEDPDKTDDKEESMPRRESRATGRGERGVVVPASKSRSRSRSRARSGRGMTQEGEVMVPATYKADENRFVLDRSDDDDDDDEEPIHEDDSRDDQTMGASPEL